jgi:hypothetical protein
MRKKSTLRSIALALTMLVSANFAKAQVAIGYTFSQSAGTYTPITGGTVLYTGTFDDNVVNVTIPSFTFDGVAYTACNVSSNGFITFGATAPATTLYAPLSSGTAYTGAIAPFGRDLQQAAAGTPEIRWETIGNEIIFQWQDVRRWNVAGERISFQLRLNTSNGQINVVYGGTITPGANTTYPQVGLRGPNNTFATNINNRNVVAATGAWLNSIAGTANNSTCYFNSANAGTVPASGTTFTWTVAPICTGTPTAGSITAPGSACSGTAFNISVTGNSGGIGTAYQWQSSADGVTFANITGATNSTYSATQTDTTWYQCVVTCTNSGLSATTAAVQVNISNFLNCYCTSAANFGGDEDITNVTLNTLNNTSACSNALYTNFTAIAAPDITPGATENASVTIATCGNSYQTSMRVYIDYNRDGDFLDAGETIYTSPASFASNTTGTVIPVSFTVPVGASTGLTRMRVVAVETGTPTSITSCGNYGYGETEDYLLNILPPPPPCSGVPNTGTLATADLTVCSGANFNLIATGATTGLDITYVWISSTDGVTFNPIAGPTTTSYTTSQTDTTWYAVVVTCTTSGLSDTTNIVQVNMESYLNCFCVSSATNTADDDIGQVIFGGLVNPVVTPTPVVNNPTSVNTYSNFDTLALVDYMQGSTNPISILQINSDIFYNTDVAVFIDYNHNGVWDLPAERVFGGSTSQGVPVTGNITIPITATTGVTRMRIELDEFGNSATMDGCGTYSYGETEDYLINITPAPPINLGLVSVDSLATGCGLGLEQVGVTMTNAGTQDILAGTTIDLTYNDGVNSFTETFTATANIPTGGVFNYVFTNTPDLSTVGTYNVSIFGVLAGDTVQVNDTSFLTVTSIQTINTFPYVLDFEANDGGLLPSGTGTAWEWGAPAQTIVNGTQGCGNNAWVVGLTNDYVANTEVYLQTVCFDFSASGTEPFVRFSNQIESEAGWDGMWLESSTDGGATWTKVLAGTTNANWYNNTTDQWFDDSNPWQTSYTTVSGVASQSSVMFRFGFSSDGSVQQEGSAIDNLFIGYAFKDVAAVAVTSPTSDCGLSSSTSITAQFTNLGNSILGFANVCYIVDGGAPVCETFTGGVAPDSVFTYTFTTPANLSALGTHTIEIYATLPGDINACDSASVTIETTPYITTFPYFEDFESGNGGWITGGTSNSFVLGTPAKTNISGAASGVNAWTTGLTGNYANNENGYVLSPCFDFTQLPANPWVALKVNYDMETTYDGAVLQMTKDDGATWVTVGAVTPQYDNNIYNWYNNTIGAAPGGSNEGWSGNDVDNSGGWIQTSHPIDTTGFSTATKVKFRVSFASDFIFNMEGFAFDDFAIGTLPQVNLNDTVVCADAIIPSGYAVGTWAWSTIDTATAVVTANVDSSANYVAANATAGSIAYDLLLWYTNEYGFINSDTALLTTHIRPVYNLGNDTLICHDATLELNAPINAAYNYVWSNGGTLDSTVVDTAGIYYVTVSINTTGCATTDSITVTESVPVDLPATLTFCADTTGILTAAGFVNYSWTGGSTNDSLVVAVSGFYAVNVVDANGCGSTDGTVVVANPLPTVNLGVDRTICENASTVINGGSGFTSYNWSTGGAAQVETITGAALGSGVSDVTLSVVDANGCSNTDTVAVTVNVAPVTNLGSDQTICANDTLDFDAGAGMTTYAWSTTETTQTIEVLGTTLGTGTHLIHVTITNSFSCTDRDTVTVVVNPNPTVALGADFTLCVNHTQTLDAGSGFNSYSWSTGDNTQTTVVDGAVLGTGTHTIDVTVTNNFGCEGTDAVVVLVDPCTGVEETENVSMNMYPNPSAGLVNMTFGNVEGTTIVEVYSIEGKLVASQNIAVSAGAVYQFDFNAVERGAYFVKVTNNGNTTTQKLILE